MNSITQNVLNCLNQVKCDETSNTEFEIRFGQFNKKKFSPGISLENFIHIQSFLGKGEVEYSFTAHHKDGTRVTQILKNPKTSPLAYPWVNSIIGERIITKKNIKTFDEPELGLRFSLSQEKTLNSVDHLFKEDNPPIFFKAMKRISLIVDCKVRVDLSMYQATSDISNIQYENMKYDVEVEALCNNCQDDLFYMVDHILKIIMQTAVIMRASEVEFVKNNYFNLVKTKKFIGSQPETIKNEKLIPDSLYALTVKLDGKRSLMFIQKGVCYLIDRKLNISKIETRFENCDNTLLDGELHKGNFYIFDILFHNGSDLRDLTLPSRLEYVSKIISENPNSHIFIKEYYYEDIYENMLKFLNSDETMNNPDFDGFILVPYNKPYPKTRDENVPLKWKPVCMNTVDFKIRKVEPNNDSKNENIYNKQETWELLCMNDEKFYYENLKSLGSIKVPLLMSQNFMNNSVVEFAYSPYTEQFYPLKVRFDKTEGNYIGVAQDNFESILTPFDLKVLKEKKRQEAVFYNMRRFHNWIKRSLISLYSNNNDTLLDLACGKGGDIQKWVDNNIKKVQGYDIDEESIQEANKRRDKVISKPTSKNFNFAFEVKDLSKEKIVTDTFFDISTCFFAIHYFYKKKEVLQFFIRNHLNNLKEDGVFIFTTLDSQRLKDIDYTFISKNLTIKKGVDKGIFGKKIDVYIKDCVLDKETTEYVVDYDTTIDIFTKEGFSLIETYTFDKCFPAWKEYGNYLTSEEKSYSFMNRVYVFRKGVNKEQPKICKKITTKELREACKNNGLSTSGTKDDLIQRLQQMKL